MKNQQLKKLVTSFDDKNNYVLNYRILKLYLSLGLELVKVNRVIEFEQDNFMESYILKILQSGQRPKIHLRKTSINL